MQTYGRPFLLVFKNTLGAFPAAARPSSGEAKKSVKRNVDVMKFRTKGSRAGVEIAGGGRPSGRQKTSVDNLTGE
jgi:hypothetical protein